MVQAAIIIPHYNDSTRLRRCLDALGPQIGPDVDVVVVDNGSTEPLDAVKAAHPQVRFLTEPRKGAAAARNRGVAETTAPLIWFLDADCLPAPDWVAAARVAAPGADLVGGGIDVFDETPAPRSGAEAFEAVFGFDYRSYIERDGFAVTANLLTRRDVFEAVGPFHDGLAEDMDWCWRATEAGFRLICDETLRVGHPSRSDWPALEKKWRRMVREGYLLNHRGTTNGPRQRAVWLAKAMVMIPSIAVHAPRILRSPKLAGGGERLACLGTLARVRGLRMIWMLRQLAGGKV